jgi:hypothetical protein
MLAFCQSRSRRQHVIPEPQPSSWIVLPRTFPPHVAFRATTVDSPGFRVHIVGLEAAACPQP